MVNRLRNAATRILTTACLLCSMSLIAEIIASTPTVTEGNWPGWRGNGSGISADGSIPVSWDLKKNLLWRTILPGEGSSSPIVFGDRLFVTASQDSGATRLVICISARSGKILWQQRIISTRIPKTDPKAGFAPSTPVTDGTMLYVFFDCPGLIAFDMTGKQVWQVMLGPFNSPYNVASSPIIVDDKVVLCCDHNGDAFIMAVDKKTGKQIWKTPRKLSLQYSTPLCISVNGKKQIVVSASTTKAYDAETGLELWSCEGLNPVVTPSPVFDGSLVYVTSGRNGPAMAIDPSGSGNVKKTNIRMLYPLGGPYVPSPLLISSLLFLSADDGHIRCLNAKGQAVIDEPLRSHFTASPVLCANTIFWPAENGDVYSLKISTGEKPGITIGAINPLKEQILASPAISNGRIFIRTALALYCIGGKSATAKSQGPVALHTTFAELSKQYSEHSTQTFADVAIRLDAVQTLGKTHFPEAVAFLKEAALKDEHWDVAEASIKSLSTYDDPETPAALMAMFNDWRPFLRVSAAQGLGRLGATEAISVLLTNATSGDVQVRIASIGALAAITIKHPDHSSEILPTLIKGLSNGDMLIKSAAIDATSKVGLLLGDQRDSVVAVIKEATMNQSPLIANAAKEAIKKFEEK